MIALSREYPSLFGSPAIHEVDEACFSLTYFARCLECTSCADQCCSYGVDIDWYNMEALRSLGPDFAEFVGIPPEQWFEKTITHDPEFPSGAHGRTREVGGKCVFAERLGRGCRIHAWCLEHGLDYHLYKPLVSILFPLTFECGALVPAAETLDRTLACRGDGPTLYEGARDELLFYFGRSFITELDSVGKIDLEHRQKGTTAR